METAVTHPSVVMISLWRNDVSRQLASRAWHLLEKSYPTLRYVWVVGDSRDATHDILQRIRQQSGRDIQILLINTDIEDRLTRLSASANFGLECVRDTDDYVMFHESDLQTPVDIVERFVAHAEAGRCPIAGWPIIPLPDGRRWFYDILAFHRDGQRFDNKPPYHPCYTSDAPFEVDGVGSCWMFHAEDARAGVRMFAYATLDMCDRLAERGRRFWVDPWIEVVQPFSLWHYQDVDAQLEGRGKR